jgi:hypothetical protein
MAAAAMAFRQRTPAARALRAPLSLLQPRLNGPASLAAALCNLRVARPPAPLPRLQLRAICSLEAEADRRREARRRHRRRPRARRSEVYLEQFSAV